MNTRVLRRCRTYLLAFFLGTVATTVSAAVPVHVVKADLRALIRAAFQSRVQFAVSIPHTVSTSTQGAWTIEGDSAVWRYAVQVPTAVSLSFHAIQSQLPDSAVLIVRGARTTTTYHGRDFRGGELWSRIHPGDALDLTLTVAAADRSTVALNITSLQAGYRSLGAGVSDHEYFRQLVRAQAATDNTVCVTNYACQVTSNNTPAAAATTAIVVGNTITCTAVLINDVPGSNLPYLLTARHCETGKLGGGNPGADAQVTVYWDATTPCGQALGSIYDPGVQTQTGAHTLVEQQDAWLLKLDVSPVVSDAQFAGFDASGAAIQGGYTIHHATGRDKQYTEWFGQAAPVTESDILGTTYVSNFLETVNQVGNIAPGASGGGLFNQSNSLVGLLTLGRVTTDPSSYGFCPAATPQAPNGTNGVADFTSLAAVWNSTSDSTSSTGNATLKSVLDPGATGTLVVSSEAAPLITFASYTRSVFFVGTVAQIQWTALTATGCTAAGGNSGDGWAGNFAASGSQMINEGATGIVTYMLTCQFPGGRVGSASLSLQWVNQPTVNISAPYVVWATRPATISWSSSVSPCSITGGGLALTNQPASGSTTTTQASAADVAYTVACGPANNSDEVATLVHYVTPSLLFAANGTDRKIGQEFFLQWLTQADSCAPSGGAPNDGWATTALRPRDDVTTFSPKVSTPGTYTYTLTCSSGSIALTQSATVTFENNAPYVTASLNPAIVTYSGSPADYSTLTWNSNLSDCEISTDHSGLPFEPNPLPQFDSNSAFGNAPWPQGTATTAPAKSGTWVLTVTCGTDALFDNKVMSAPVTLSVNAPAAPTAAISFNPTTVLAGQNFTISWISANTLDCAQTGGIPNESWGAVGVSSNLPPTGSASETAQAGTFTFTLTCASVDGSQAPVTAQANLTVQALSLTLTPPSVSVSAGDSFTLNWSSTAATSCTASGGGANGMSWSGAVGTSGTLSQTATTTGTYTYSLSCSVGNQSTSQSSVITVSAASSSGSGGSSGGGAAGGHGGGGGLGLLELGLLAGCLATLRRSLTY